MLPPAGPVDPDREGQPVLAHESVERCGPHDVVVLEHRVQANHGDILLGEQLPYLASLRQAVRDAGRAQHLKIPRGAAAEQIQADLYQALQKTTIA